jgi:hypothetical protein
MAAFRVLFLLYFFLLLPSYTQNGVRSCNPITTHDKHEACPVPSGMNILEPSII